MTMGHGQLEWRCRRGTRELDLLLQAWLREAYDRSSLDDQIGFIELLEWQDDQLAPLLLGQAESANGRINTLAGKIRALSLSRP